MKCECGCGKTTNLRWGVPSRFIAGHNAKIQRTAYHPNRIAAVTKHGKSHTKEYQRYAQAKSRCNCPTSARYSSYGGRGILFKFASFGQFFAELGQCPKRRTLDRINNDGHYEPGNVRWATKKQQYASRRPWNWRAAAVHKGDGI